MTNTSATGGPLVPAVTPAPLEGTALLDLIQETLVGLTGISTTLVRPRFQAEPANIPDTGTLWMAFGIIERPGDTFPVIGHVGDAAAGDGADNYQQQEKLVVLCSLYDNGSGSAAMGTAAKLRDGLKIPQNMEALGAAQITLASVNDIEILPSLLKQLWTFRCDLKIYFNRQVTRVYPILNLESAEVELITDDPTRITDIDPTRITDIQVNPPTP